MNTDLIRFKADTPRSYDICIIRDMQAIPAADLTTDPARPGNVQRGTLEYGGAVGRLHLSRENVKDPLYPDSAQFRSDKEGWHTGSADCDCPSRFDCVACATIAVTGPLHSVIAMIPQGVTFQLENTVRRPAITLGLILCFIVSDVTAEKYTCGVDFESQCTESGCSAFGEKDDGNVKPVFARFDDEGSFQICMYTGCYEGKGRVLTTRPFLSIVQERVKWTGTNPDETDIFIVLQRNELIGMFKASSFVQPMSCVVMEDKE